MSKWPFVVRRKSRHLNQTESGLQKYDVTDCAGEINLADLEVVRWAPVWMTRAERLLLYTLSFTLRPERYLEIGTLQGGSALLVAAAMDALNTGGRLICVDPKPQIIPEHWQRLANRTLLLEGHSPDILPQACEMAGGKFDLILIDGDHTYAGALRDAQGVLPFAADGAYILFHDSFFVEVARAIDDFVLEHAQELVDFGSLTREYTSAPDFDSVQWGGLRMVQVRRVA
jgi:predicted O-methyltransferase YrrM